MSINFTPVYHDRLLRLIGVPLLGFLYRHIGEPSALIGLLRDPVYYVDVSVAILSVWFLWELVKFIIRHLDQRYPWAQHFFQRLLVQSILVYGITVLFVVLLTFLYNDIVMRDHRNQLFDISFVFVVDVPVALLLMTIIQLLYYVLYLQGFYEQELAVRNAVPTSSDYQAATPVRKNVLVYFGKSLLPIALGEVAYFHKAGEVTLVRTLENQDYRVDQTLEQLMVTLPAGNFYRLNRQLLARLEAVKEVKSDPSGKLLVTLEPDFQETVTVSRKKAKEFKEWLNG